MFTFLGIFFIKKKPPASTTTCVSEGFGTLPGGRVPRARGRAGAHFRDVRGQQGKTSREKNTPGSRRLTRTLARRVFPGCASLENRVCVRKPFSPLLSSSFGSGFPRPPSLSLPLISAASPSAAWPSPAASVMPLSSPRSARTLSFPSDCLHIHPFMLACSLMAVAGVLPGARREERPGPRL